MLSLVQPWTARAETAGSMAHVSVKLEVEVTDDFLVDELDLIPLKERLKILVASNIGSSGSVIERESDGLASSVMPIDEVIKREEGDCSLQDVALDHAGLNLSEEGKGGKVSKEQGQAYCTGERDAAEYATRASKVDYGTCQLGSPIDSRHETHANNSSCSSQRTFPIVKGDFVEPINVEADIHDLPKRPIHSTFSVKVECSYNKTVKPNKNVTCGSVQKVHEGYDVKNETYGELETDEVDHIPLEERRRMLVSRISVETTEQVSAQFTFLIDGVSQHTSVDIKEESNYVAENNFHSITQNMSSKFFQSLPSDSSINDILGASSMLPYCSPNGNNFREGLSPEPSGLGGFEENKKECLSEISTMKFESEVGQAFLPVNFNNMLGSALPTFPAKIKVENLEDDLNCPSKNATGMLSCCSKLSLKSEMGVYNESSEDVVDHLPLLQRMKFLIPSKSLNLYDVKDFKCSRTNLSCAIECRPAISEADKPQGVRYRRKRKKTATDSVEMALEEDAPGLLKVLMDKGIMIDEMKLYGNTDSEDALDDTFDKDSFRDLETVISKLFNQRATLKFGPERCTKGSKPSYCLACLIALVEQTRYLRFRKWPVEWGWCRDLQSFIFVFKRHNRIVLERPEYGYATYFFELVDSLTIDWQVKRLVTAMKLTSCGRATLIENKSLLVGEDLTEGEARVLKEYGWTPNCGLGSMLNYCDRVIHDIYKERNGYEWRSKIGKLLMDGYNGGIIVLANLPKRVIGYNNTQTPEIKLELEPLI